MRNEDIYCIKCDYDLSHSEELRCPECGREFDPDDPTTFESSNYRPCPSYLKFGLVLSFYPFTFILCLYAAWVVGRIKLGHWPIAYQDDPKYFMLGTLQFFTGILMLITYGAFVALTASLGLILAGFINGFRKRSANPWLALYIMIWTIVAWVGTMLYLRWDPLRVSTWFFD